MFPTIVSFTGLDIETSEFHRRHDGRIPDGWLIHEFQLEDYYSDPVRDLGIWINRNLRGRWAFRHAMTLSGSTIFLAFENSNDAIMFRLLGGEKAFHNPSR